MITLLTCFKNFTGDNAIRQRNALNSWKALDPDIEIMLFGNPGGAEQIVREFGLKHYPDVPMFEERLVQIDAMFDIAQAEGKYDIQAYVNGDMIFGGDFLAALKVVEFDKFMAIGRRWTFPVQDSLPVDCIERVIKLQNSIRAEVELDGFQSIDYFCYRRGTFVDLKPLYLGTVTWDNYMIYHCISNKIPVVDLTAAITAVHQKHDYVYLPGKRDEFYSGPAAQHNRDLIGGWEKLFGTNDSTHIVKDGKVNPAREYEYVDRREDRLREFHPKLFGWLRFWKLRSLLAKYWLWA